MASTSRATMDERTPATVTAEIRKLSDLLDMSQTLGSTLNLKAALSRVLEILSEHHGAQSASVMLLDRESGQLVIEASAGVQWQAASRARYRLGEGITGRVVQSGKPIVVPMVSQEPLFLNRTGVVKDSRKDEMSFIGVPIPLDTRTVGVLGVTLPYDPAFIPRALELYIVTRAQSQDLFGLLAVLNQMQFEDDFSPDERANLMRWRQTFQPGALRDAGVDYLLYSDVWYSFTSEDTAATLNDPSRYEPVAQWWHPALQENYVLLRVAGAP